VDIKKKTAADLKAIKKRLDEAAGDATKMK
jgi:hypothetical protein